VRTKGEILGTVEGEMRGDFGAETGPITNIAEYLGFVERDKLSEFRLESNDNQPKYLRWKGVVVGRRNAQPEKMLVCHHYVVF
jgi:hypothetical protein